MRAERSLQHDLRGRPRGGLPRFRPDVLLRIRPRHAPVTGLRAVLSLRPCRRNDGRRSLSQRAFQARVGWPMDGPWCSLAIRGPGCRRILYWRMAARSSLRGAAVVDLLHPRTDSPHHTGQAHRRRSLAHLRARGSASAYARHRLQRAMASGGRCPERILRWAF